MKTYRITIEITVTTKLVIIRFHLRDQPFCRAVNVGCTDDEAVQLPVVFVDALKRALRAEAFFRFGKGAGRKLRVHIDADRLAGVRKALGESE